MSVSRRISQTLTALLRSAIDDRNVFPTRGEHRRLAEHLLLEWYRRADEKIHQPNDDITLQRALVHAILSLPDTNRKED